MRKNKSELPIMAICKQISNIRAPDYNCDYINSIKIWDKQVKIRGKPILGIV